MPAVLNFLKPQVANNPRYSILALLPVAVLTVAAASPGSWRRTRLALVGLLVVGMAWSLANHYGDPAYWREDVRGAVRLADTASPAVNRVVWCPNYLDNVAKRYDRSGRPTVDLNLTPPDAAEQLEKLRGQLASAERWMLVYGRTEYGDPRHLIPGWLDENFTVLDRKKLTGLQVFTLGPKAVAPALGL